MDAGTVVLFTAASLALIVVPGPSVGFILASTLRHGRPAGLSATVGVETGYLVHVLAAVAGVSAVLAASATASTAVKVTGAAWLLWLAVRAWRAATPGTSGTPPPGEVRTGGESPRRGTRRGTRRTGSGLRRVGPAGLARSARSAPGSWWAR